MFDFEKAVLGLDNLQLDNDYDEKTQLPSALGNSVRRLIKTPSSSNPPSQYNSDTDEPAPRPSKQQQTVVTIDHNYIASNQRKAIGKSDFTSLCVLGRGA
jgi:hypothetical protein